MSKTLLKVLNKKLVKEFYDLNVSNDSLNYFRDKVGDNKFKGDIELINKIRRNFLVGRLEEVDGDKVTKSYGTLIMKAYKDEIYYINNRRGTFRFIHNRRKKAILNKIFGL